MSLAKKCDRCGAYFGCTDTYVDPEFNDTMFPKFNRVHIFMKDQPAMFNEPHRDICPKCQEELWKWLNMKNEPKTADDVDALDIIEGR